MWMGILSSILEFGGEYKWWLVGALGAVMLAWFSWSWVDGYIDDQVQAARIEAISECNAVQLEEDLRVANERLAQSEKRTQDLLDELSSRDIEIRELEEFIEDAQEELSQYDTGEISERTRVFMRILSERSDQYYENPN